MKIEDFVRSVLPNFDRTVIKEDLNGVKEKLTNITIPVYEEAVSTLSKDRFKKGTLGKFQDNCISRLGPQKGNYLDTILHSVKNINKKIDNVLNLIDEYYAKDVTREGMSYLRVTLLQWVETAGFVDKYARKLLDVTYMMLTEQFDRSQNINWRKHRGLKFLLVREYDFWTALKALGLNEREEKNKIERIPEALAKADKVSEARQLMGLSNIDPLGFGLISARFNPIYHVRMAVARWQVKNYKKAQVEKESLELKLEFLKQRREGKKNAQLEQTIDYTQDRLDELEYEIDKMEREANG